MTRERVTKEGVTEGLSDREEGTKGSDIRKDNRGTRVPVKSGKPFSSKKSELYGCQLWGTLNRQES